MSARAVLGVVLFVLGCIISVLFGLGWVPLWAYGCWLSFLVGGAVGSTVEAIAAEGDAA